MCRSLWRSICHPAMLLHINDTHPLTPCSHSVLWAIPHTRPSLCTYFKQFVKSPPWLLALNALWEVFFFFLSLLLVAVSLVPNTVMGTLLTHYLYIVDCLCRWCKLLWERYSLKKGCRGGVVSYYRICAGLESGSDSVLWNWKRGRGSPKERACLTFEAEEERVFMEWWITRVREPAGCQDIGRSAGKNTWVRLLVFSIQN